MMKYNPAIIDFFKRHNMYDEEMFNYLQENTIMIDFKDPDQRGFIGCFYVQDKKGRLTKIVLNIPYVYDYKTALINIHEITHGIENYKKLGKKFKKDNTVEALPILYEKIYIMENDNEELTKYGEYLDTLCGRDNATEYQMALKVRDELLSNYSYDMNKMKRMTKRLVRKYK